MSNYGTVQERVQRGVKWLDRHKKDWRKEVVVKDLDMSDGCRCVLGQVFAKPAAKEYEYTDEDIKAGWVDAFTWVIGKFNRRRGSVVLCREPAKYGFDCTDADTNEENNRDYANLQREWKKVLKAS